MAEPAWQVELDKVRTCLGEISLLIEGLKTPSEVGRKPAPTDIDQHPLLAPFLECLRSSAWMLIPEKGMVACSISQGRAARGFSVSLD